MFQLIRTVTFSAVLGLVIVAATEGASMNQQLREPAAVPLDFLRWIERDASWLRESLAAQGVSTGYTISDGALVATTVEALRHANRIRSFAHLAAPGLRLPYLDLAVEGADEQRERCVTLFPRSIAPQIGPQDYARESFPAADADPTILAMCRVGAAGAEYAKLDRDAFRARYFDARRDLKIEFAELNSDAAFIACAIDHGFFVLQQDLTGRLRLGAE
jgi:hypothetical protein